MHETENDWRKEEGERTCSPRSRPLLTHDPRYPVVIDLELLVADSREESDRICLASEDDEEGDHREREPAAASRQGRAGAVDKFRPVVRPGAEGDACGRGRGESPRSASAMAERREERYSPAEKMMKIEINVMAPEVAV